MLAMKKYEGMLEIVLSQLQHFVVLGQIIYQILYEHQVVGVERRQFNLVKVRS